MGAVTVETKTIKRIGFTKKNENRERATLNVDGKKIPISMGTNINDEYYMTISLADAQKLLGELLSDILPSKYVSIHVDYSGPKHGW